MRAGRALALLTVAGIVAGCGGASSSATATPTGGATPTAAPTAAKGSEAPSQPPSAATTAAPTAAPSPTPAPTAAPLAISTLVTNALKGTVPKTSAATVLGAINAAMNADSYQGKWKDMVLPDNWKACQGRYNNQVMGGSNELVTVGCAASAIGLYMLYQQGGGSAYVNAFTKLIDYIWTRPDLNIARKGITGDIKNCERFSGDTFKPCSGG